MERKIAKRQRLRAPSVDAERGGKRGPQALHEGVPFVLGDNFLRLVVLLEFGVLLLEAELVLSGAIGLARFLGIPDVVTRLSEILLQDAAVAASAAASSFTLLTATATGHGSLVPL